PKRTRGGRFRLPRIWPRLTWRWRMSWSLEGSTLRARMTSISGLWRSRPVMHRYCAIAVTLRPSWGSSLPALRRAVVLDPLDLAGRTSLGGSLYLARQYRESAVAYAEAISIDPNFTSIYGGRGLAFLALGDLERARTSCEIKRDFWVNQWCLAIVYDKLGRRADADAEVAKVKAAEGDAAAYQYATIYAQRGDRTQALRWLDTTMRLRDPGLLELKTDPLLDPLRAEP